MSEPIGQEPEALTAAAPLLVTTPGPNVTLGPGDTLTDSATLSGGFNPTGTLIFQLFDPSNTVVDTETLSVAGNGTYHTLTGFTPSAAGTYQWLVTYNGDANNNSVTSPLGSEPEVVSSETATPEPSTISTVSLAGLLGLGYWLRTKRRTPSL